MCNLEGTILKRSLTKKVAFSCAFRNKKEYAEILHVGGMMWGVQEEGFHQEKNVIKVETE